MSRPRGEIRIALAKAAAELVEERGAVGGLDICAKAQVGFRYGLRTLKDMVRCGELVQVGRFKPAGRTRWHGLYEPSDTECVAVPYSGLDGALRTFLGTGG